MNVVPFQERLTSENVERILAEGWDVIVDGADNFPTRYLVNDASVWSGIPVVHGSIFRFEGQVTVFDPGVGPCYRCLFPQPPPPELAPSCAEGGVLGVLPGIIGSIQANETLKLVLGRGDSLAGRLLLFDALGRRWTRSRSAALDCPVCGDRPTITEYVDYVEFCNAPVQPDGRRAHPPTLRAEVGGARELAAEGGTVGEVLDDLVERYPPLGDQLLQDGELAPFVNVYVDGEDVRTRDGLDTRVGRDQLILLPALAGGARTIPASLLDLVGSTPLLELPPLPEAGVRLSRSSRARTRRVDQGPDRQGDARRRRGHGELVPGRRLLEPTSGNTGSRSRSWRAPRSTRSPASSQPT